MVIRCYPHLGQNLPTIDNPTKTNMTLKPWVGSGAESARVLVEYCSHNYGTSSFPMGKPSINVKQHYGSTIGTMPRRWLFRNLFVKTVFLCIVQTTASVVSVVVSRTLFEIASILSMAIRPEMCFFPNPPVLPDSSATRVLSSATGSAAQPPAAAAAGAARRSVGPRGAGARRFGSAAFS